MIKVLLRINILIFVFLCFANYDAVSGINHKNLTIEILQQKNVSANFKNKKLDEILLSICRQADVEYGYQNNGVVNKDELFSLIVENCSLKEALDKLFTNTKYNYSIVNNRIIISKRTEIGTKNEKVSVDGKVMDAKNKPIAGATALVVGTSDGAITNEHGEFMLMLKPGQQLEVSFLGYLTKTIVVQQSEQNFIVHLEDDVLKMNDVVVTGIFNKAKESYTGSVTTVTAKDLKNFKGQNLVNTLRNFDPSLNIVINNDFGSNPNLLPEINIRGNSSLPMSVKDLNENAQAQLNAPLVIMDGFRVPLQKLLDFNDEEIETINILKDASATAIYGSAGANGVIVIVTKAPEVGKLKIYVQAGINLEIPDLTSYDLLNASEKLELERKLGMYNSINPATDIDLKKNYNRILNDINSGVDTYWLSKPLNTGVGQRYNARFEGGSEEFRWSASLGYNNISGVMKGSEKNTLNGGVNLSYNIKNVIFQNQTMITSNIGIESNYGNFSDYTKMNPFWKTHDENGNLIKQYYHDGMINNPLYNASLSGKDTKEYFEFVNNFSIEWDIMDALKFRAKIGISKQTNSSDKLKSSKHTDFIKYEGEDYFRKGNYTYGTGNSMNYDGNITLSYSKTFNEKHQLYVGLDYSMTENNSNGYKFIAEGFPNENLQYLANAMQYEKNGKPAGNEAISRSVGMTGNANYTYANRYFVDLSYRMDGSSQFGSKNRFAPFWSAGMGWNIHREKFMQDNKVINNLRIKGSYGITGSQQFDSYQALSMYKDMTNDRYVMWNGIELMGLGNENLKWQNTNQLSGGIEVGLFGNRLTGSVEAYHKLTSNLLSQMDIPLSNGFSSYTDNVGKVKNIGYEATVSGYIIRDNTRDIMWSVTGKIAYNKNEITELSDAIKIQTQSYLDKKDAPLERLIFEGKSQSSIYVVPSLGIDPTTGQEIFIDQNGNVSYDWDSRNRVYAGISEPKFRGNLSTMVSYKNLSLNLSFGFHFGGQQYNQTLIDRVEVTKSQARYNVDRRVLEQRWMQPGDVSFYKGFYKPDGNAALETKYSSRFVQDDNTFELQSMSLQYKLISKWLHEKCKLQSVNLAFNMSNVFYISTIKRERGLQYPFSRSASLSVSLLF